MSTESKWRVLLDYSFVLWNMIGHKDASDWGTYYISPDAVREALDDRQD